MNPNPWLPYEGEYEKQEYDIRLIDGTEILNCWPNAGNFTELVGGCKQRDIRCELSASGKIIPCPVTHFRVSHPDSWDLMDQQKAKAPL